MTGWVLLEAGWLFGTMGLPASVMGGGWLMWRRFLPEPLGAQLEQDPPAPQWPHKLPLEPELAYLQQLDKVPDDKGTVYRPKHAAEPLDDTGEWPEIRTRGGTWLPKGLRRTARTVGSGSTSPAKLLRKRLDRLTQGST